MPTLDNIPSSWQVEIPEEEMAKRRINFYQRQGFCLMGKALPTAYPIEQATTTCLCYIMAYGDIESGKDFDPVN